MPSPVNDLSLSEALTGLTTLQRRARDALNDGAPEDAFIAFMLIETLAHTAMQRLNALKYDGNQPGRLNL